MLLRTSMLQAIKITLFAFITWVITASDIYADPVRPGQPAPSGASSTLAPQQIEALVQQLGDKQFNKRKQARDMLEQLGPVALPYLQAALEKEKDPEIRRHLQSLVPSMEQLAALKPTTITLVGKDKPFSDVCKEIESQTGYRIELVNVQNKNINLSMDWDKLDFWRALQSLCQQQGLMFQEGWYGNDNATIRLMPGESNDAFLCLDGPFRITATGIYYNRNLTFNRAGNGAGLGLSESLQVNLTVTVEPRMPLLTVKQPVFTEAMSDTGESLLLPIEPNRHHYYQHGYRSYMHQVHGQLKPLSNVRKLRSLKGVIPVTVVSQTKPIITIDKLVEAKGKTFKNGTSTITIENLTQDRGQPGIKMSVTDTSPNGPNDYAWMNTIQQRIEVFDENGTKLQNYGGSWGMNGNNNVHGTFHFSGVPAKLIYNDWITLNYQIPFQFDDLPMP